MANSHQDSLSIKNMQVLSSTLVHSNHSCEANKCPIFKPFFFVYQIKGVQCIISNKIISLTISRGQILPHKMLFFGVLKMIIF